MDVVGLMCKALNREKIMKKLITSDNVNEIAKKQGYGFFSTVPTLMPDTRYIKLKIEEINVPKNKQEK